MRTRTVVAAVAGVAAVVLARRFFHAGLAAAFAATGLGSLARTIFTARAFYYVLSAVSGTLALAVCTWLFLLCAGKLASKRWKRGLLWSVPVLWVGLAVAPVPSWVALLVSAAVSMIAGTR